MSSSKQLKYPSFMGSSTYYLPENSQAKNRLLPYGASSFVNFNNKKKNIEISTEQKVEYG